MHLWYLSVKQAANAESKMTKQVDTKLYHTAYSEIIYHNTIFFSPNVYTPPPIIPLHHISLLKTDNLQVHNVSNVIIVSPIMTTYTELGC